MYAMQVFDGSDDKKELLRVDFEKYKLTLVDKQMCKLEINGQIRINLHQKIKNGVKGKRQKVLQNKYLKNN